MKQGILTLIGGAEDKRDEKKVLKTIIQKTNAKNVVIIPTASSYPRDVFETYLKAFTDLGVENVTNFDIRYPDEAEKKEYFDVLEKTDLVFFSGGDQTILVRVLGETKLFHKIRMKFYAGELHIAGTSAGAAAASNPMLYDGDYQGFKKDAINSEAGFGFLPTITIDTHFLQRERIARLSQFCISGKSNRGIGLDEDTAIMIFPDNKFTVIGSGMVTLINVGSLMRSNYKKIEKDQTINFNNLRIGFLSEGASFSIRRWMILKK